MTVGNSGTFGSDSGVGSTIALLETRLPVAQERRRELEEELAAVTAQIEAMTGVLDGLRALAGTPLDSRVESAAAVQLPAAQELVEAHQPNVRQSGVTGADVQPAQAATRPARKTTSKKKPATTTAKKPTARKTTNRKTVAPDAAPASTESAARPTAATKQTAAKAVAKKTTKGSPSKATAKKTSPAGKPEADVSDAPSPAKRRRVADADSVLAVLAKMAGPLRAREVTEELGLEAITGNVNVIRTQLERLASSGRAQRTGRGLYAAAE